MALNIKDAETERLAIEVAALAGESKTRAVKVALQQRRQRLSLGGAPDERVLALERFLADEAWPQIPSDILGKPVSRSAREEILGLGPDGV